MEARGIQLFDLLSASRDYRARGDGIQGAAGQLAEGRQRGGSAGFTHGRATSEETDGRREPVWRLVRAYGATKYGLPPSDCRDTIGAHPGGGAAIGTVCEQALRLGARGSREPPQRGRYGGGEGEEQGRCDSGSSWPGLCHGPSR